MFAEKETTWAENTLKTMSLDEKIGQIFMIAAYIDSEFAKKETGNLAVIQEMEKYITEYHVGGLAYVGPSECLKQVNLTNHYQEKSKHPLLIAQDLEWGLSMRIKDGMRFPKNLTLGAVKDNYLIYEMGKEIARQAKLIGVHMNLSPVLDVNTESENIAINVRSFGNSPLLVAEKGIEMIRGLQDGGIVASAKHFPGLGNITVDPHLGLPFSNSERKHLFEVELYPFIQAINAGVLSIQTEHLILPALEPDLNTPSSLSKKIIADLLKKELGFKGLVLSGALRMKALTENFSEKEIILKAFFAGNDMLLMPQNFPNAYQIIKKAVVEGVITEKDLDEHVLKILQLKEVAKLHLQRQTEVPKMEELHTDLAKALKQKLFQNAIKIVRNDHSLIPISSRKEAAGVYVQIGEHLSTNYFDILSKELSLDWIILPLEETNLERISDLLKDLEKYSFILLTVYPADSRRIEKIRLLEEKKQEEELNRFRVHGMSDFYLKLVDLFKQYDSKTVVTFFGNPFGIHFFDHFSTVLMAYEEDPIAERVAADFLIGKKFF
jgi:beta-N-acetylhexosaminidase